jgi:hypothetical protein
MYVAHHQWETHGANSIPWRVEQPMAAQRIEVASCNRGLIVDAQTFAQLLSGLQTFKALEMRLGPGTKATLIMGSIYVSAKHYSTPQRHSVIRRTGSTAIAELHSHSLGIFS